MFVNKKKLLKSNESLILCYFVCLMPFIDIFLCLCFGESFMSLTRGTSIYLLLFIFLVIYVSFIVKNAILNSNNKFIDYNLKCLSICLLLAMLFMLVNLLFNRGNLYILFLLLTFICVSYSILCLDKKNLRLLVYFFIFSMAFNVLLGLVDIRNEFIPPFTMFVYPMSLQFSNPDYSSILIILLLFFTILCLCYEKKKWLKILLWTCFLVVNIGLFIGGVYASETAYFLGLFAIFIWFIIRKDKHSKLIFIALIISVVISFLVWLIPGMNDISTANANYFYESIAVIDHKFGTHLLKAISTFFSKIFGGGSINSVAGSDGWNRDELNMEALRVIFSSVWCCVFGKGIGFSIATVQPHNLFLNIWMDYGLIGLSFVLFIIIYVFVNFFKSKKNKVNIILFITTVSLLFNYWFIYTNFTLIYLGIAFATLYIFSSKNIICHNNN